MIIQLAASSESNATFQCPEGAFGSKLLDCYEVPCKKDKTKKAYKFIFLAYDELSKKFYKVGKEFEQNKGGIARLTEFLNSWLGPEYVSKMGQELDPEVLIGTPGDIVTKHYESGKHEFPYVDLVAIHPAGHLTRKKAA